MTPAELEAALTWANTINLEVYYYWCTAIMILIHAGFMMYEMGASRVKHTLAAGTKNVLAFAYMIPTFWMFGWWIYLAMYNGFTPDWDAASAGFPGAIAWDRTCRTTLPAFSGVRSRCSPVPRRRSCPVR